MKKLGILLIVLFVSVALAGCVTIKKVVKERVDQDIEGNQGYLQGETEASNIDRPTEREFFDIKVEIPTWTELKKKMPKRNKKEVAESRTVTQDSNLSGNRGFVSTSGTADVDIPNNYEDFSYYEPEEDYTEPVPVIEEVKKASYQEYTVKKNDTLSHIAKRFYDRASKWTLIYEANADRIKDPSRIKPGTVLIIPDIEEAENRYIK